MSAVGTPRARGRARGGACERPAGRRGDAVASTLFDAPEGGPTLEDLVSGTWDGLVIQRQAGCPWCGGVLVAAYGAHALPSEGRCADCGCTLS